MRSEIYWRVNVLFSEEDGHRFLSRLDAFARSYQGHDDVAGTGHQSWRFPTEWDARAFARRAQDFIPEVTVIEPEEDNSL